MLILLEVVVGAEDVAVADHDSLEPKDPLRAEWVEEHLLSEARTAQFHHLPVLLGYHQRGEPEELLHLVSNL